MCDTCKPKKFTDSTRKGKGKRMKSRKNIRKQHPKGWVKNLHYFHLGGQCGQSCPCCRAEVYLKGIDPGAKWGACPTCLHS